MKNKEPFELLKVQNILKTRETFENIRNQSNRMSLRFRLTILVSIELVVCILIALGVWVLLRDHITINSNLLLLIALVVISLIIGSVVTGLLSRHFFGPIKKLREAIGKVADGDFSVRLDIKSNSKEIREIYSGFNLMAHELASTEILQTDFVSNVSHEFKTPITAIEGYTTLLQGCESLDGDQQQYVEKILFNTRRLSDLVGNILLLSKLENKSIETHKTTYRLDEQVRQSIVALEPAWAKKDIEFDVDLESVDYLGSEMIMHHVWDNLIGNAIKFSPNGGLILIRLKTEVSRIIFTVEDSGAGLSEESLKHIFDKFYQADSSHKQEGNGLGLALVKRILLISGGEIFAENRKAGGAKFTVVLNK